VTVEALAYEGEAAAGILADSNLPEGWTQAPLEALGEWGSGGTPKRGVSGYFGGDIPWLKIGDLTDGVVVAAEESITPLGLRNSAAKLLPPDVLLVAMYGSIGKLGVTGVACATNQAIAFCRPFTDAVDLWYLFWALRYAQPRLVAEGKGGTQANISQTVLRGFQVPLPPLPEQERIVEEIEAVLVRVDSARAGLARVPTILKRFRQSVLAAACSGRLTENWRRQDVTSSLAGDHPVQDDAEDEQSSSLNSPDFSEPLPTTWSWITVEDACERIIDYRGRTPPLSIRGIPHIRTTNIRKGRVNWSTESFVSAATYKAYMTRGIPRRGDVLFTMEAPLGEAATVEDDRPFSLAQRILLLRARQDLMIGAYCALALQSRHVRAAIEMRSTGSTVRGVAFKRLRFVLLPIPPLEEQHEIVRRVEALFALADAIEQRVARASARADKLTQAILAKAFRGELVPTEAELARHEGRDYEPASDLLERIRQERAQAAPGRSGSRKPATRR
jgi:type I restriction enzyme, S subunit